MIEPTQRWIILEELLRFRELDERVLLVLVARAGITSLVDLTKRLKELEEKGCVMVSEYPLVELGQAVRSVKITHRGRAILNRKTSDDDIKPPQNI